jgi:hypothetical protein
LSAHGIERSNARASEIDVLPTVGAQSSTATVTTAHAAMMVKIRRRMLTSGYPRP